MSAERPVAYVVPHTHWDREWYLPFQTFRARLVDVVDRVLDLLADERFRRFTLDGQAVVLDDYLEARPERRAAVEAAVRSGRLRIGPWYVLADEFLVSPEALVRNLSLGTATCRAFGSPMGVAYTPDSFGHIAQLPLLVQGFGMDTVVFERGVGDEGERLRGEFEWVSADGSCRTFAVHLLGTYSAAAGIGHVDWELRDDYDPDRAVRQARAVLFGDATLGPEFPVWLRESIERLPRGIVPYATGEAVLLLNGSDHLFPQGELPEAIDDLNAAIDGVHFVHADLEEFVRAARAQGGRLETHRGEFRGSRYQHVLPGVLSTRMPLKQANHACETLLERFAEPLTALAALHGAPDARHLLALAWRTLLLNHPHDSICGCSVDAVHREMASRFEQVEQLGTDLLDRAVAALAGTGHDPREARTGPGHLALVNPLPVDTPAVVEVELLLDPGEADGLRVLDATGAQLPVQIEVRPTRAPGRADERRDAATVLVGALLPALSVTAATVTTGTGTDGRSTNAAAAGARAGGPDVHARLGTVRAGDEGGSRVLENDLVRVAVDPHGAVTLHDRRSGHVSPLDLRFEDVADAGDEYDFSALHDDEPVIVARTAAPPERGLGGPLRATLLLRYRLELPARLDDDRRRRVGSAPTEATLTLGLDAGSPRLDLTVELDNRACDHRLRLLVGTGRMADTVWADGHFHTLERPTRPPSGDAWFQRPVPTSHQRRFVAVEEGGRGLAVLNRGLPEYEAIPGPSGVDLAITLLRCVGWLSRDDLASRPQGAGPTLPTPEAQLIGPHRFELAVLPFDGRWWEGDLPVEAERFVARPRALRSAAPVDARLLEITPPLTLSACTQAATDGGLLVRVWNPAPVRTTGRLTVHRPLRAAHLARLDGTRLGTVEHAEGVVDVVLDGSQVLTLELAFAGEEAGR